MDGLFTSLFPNGTIVFRTKLHIWHSTFQSSTLAGHDVAKVSWNPCMFSPESRSLWLQLTIQA